MRRVLGWIGHGLIIVVGAFVLAGAVAFTAGRFDYAYVPPLDTIADGTRFARASDYDVLGQSLSGADLATLRAAGAADAARAQAAVKLDDALEAEGREAFYRETFGNEVFLSDVLGLTDGAVPAWRFAAALLELGGRGTTDLRVKLDRDVTIGGGIWKAGDTISTGLVVPKGSWLPLGTRVTLVGGRVRVGLTCALCHAAPDPASGRLVEGAPNTGLNLGLLLSLSSNPGAMFPWSGVSTLDPYRTQPENFVRRSAGGTGTLPDPAALARDVRSDFAAWPPGTADTTFDGVANPTSIPPLWTREAHPYGWSGHAALGPFAGAWTMSFHAFAIDPVSLAPAAETLFGLDPEIYLGTLLQHASRDDYRSAPGEGRKPSDVLAQGGPDRPGPGLNRTVALPGFPKGSFVAPVGLVPIEHGQPALRPTLALAAFMPRLKPPPAGSTPADAVRTGRAVFDRAGCAACHSGPALTSHRVWPASVIGSEPTRARAFARLDGTFAPPRIFPADTPLPLPPFPQTIDVPIPDEGQVWLGWARNRTGGGYKVPGLLGLRWTAPYLHDGGVAVGPDPGRAAGIAATAWSGVPPDPRNSLRALVDRSERERVSAANHAWPAARLAHVTGEGHAYWADAAAGVAAADQDALISYLLSLDELQPPPPPLPLNPG